MTTSPCSLAVLGLLAAGGAAAQDVALPSGLPAKLYDVVLERAGGETLAPDAFTDAEADAAAPAPVVAADGIARFRVLVPGLGGDGARFGDVEGDFAWVCEALALPALARNGWSASEVTVSLSDREVEFGATDAEAVQFFQGFRIEGGACVPQAF